MASAYIVDAVRTPRGRGKAERGALSNIHPQELLAQTLNALATRSGIDPRQVDDVIVGSASQVNDQGGNIARNAVLAANWPYEVSAISINRFCGSGLSAVEFASMGVMSGQQDLVVAGGVESMSRVAMGADGSNGDGNNPQLRARYFQVPQGISADLIATLDGADRSKIDRFALRSQELAARAIAENRFARSLIPVIDPRTQAVVLSQDELPRATTYAGLSELAPSFVKVGAIVADDRGRTLDQIALASYPRVDAIEHVHTAGNSSGLADGAAAVLVASEQYVRDHQLKPRARVRALANVGSEPIIKLTAPTPASQQALRRAGMQVRDIDLWEINEAFAAIPLRTIRELELDPERVNVNGGAIALGHPLGATGAILVGTALDELERRNLSTALVTLCIAGGQGVALILERV
ncbi:MAG TPA: acetyl-CoA C-acetyltransferase [Polyangiales bacterium]|nr:acetyl-CoA C-acetyltransferase [Polyangiales bacterium]